MDVAKEDIEQVRQAFLSEVNERGENSIHPKDLERIKKDDKWLGRFYKHQENKLKETVEMIWESVTWRKEFGTNEINETNVKMDLIIQGGFFPFGKDIDGKTILVFKCKKHIKGSQDMDELKRCVIFWFERIEREVAGEPISIFFDMDGCGLSNMDMEFTKYLINLFKCYYPYFLNYILIFEMPWVLSAAFKVIKSWLPPKAIEKIKFVTKKDITKFVKEEYVLSCWGGTNDYQFRYVPEEGTAPLTQNNNNKKVHFSVSSPSMSETAASSGDNKDGDLVVNPKDIITFLKEGNELVSTVNLHNTGNNVVAFKLKTTSPEKFRVKPSTGLLKPDDKVTITVTLLQGFHLGGLSKDKFLIMNALWDEKEDMELSEFWKNTQGKKIDQIRLKCNQTGDLSKNGSLPTTNSVIEDGLAVGKLSTSVAQLSLCQNELHSTVKKLQYLQTVTLFLVVILGVALVYFLKYERGEYGMYCRKSD